MGSPQAREAMNTNRLVYAALIATTVVWGGSFVAIKHVLQYVTPLQLVLLRFAPASGVFAAVLCLRHRHVWPRMLRDDWLLLLLSGVSGVFVYHLALNSGEMTIPAGTASLLMALNPAFIFALSQLTLREKPTRTQLGGLLLAFVGLVIVVRFASRETIDFHYLRGVLITLVAPISWAVYTVLSRPLARRYPPLAVTGLSTILGSLPLAVTVRPILLHTIAVLPWDAWASVAFLALLSTVGGVTVWTFGLQALPAGRVGSFIYLVPLWGALLSRLMLAEPISAWFVLGAGIILAGVMLVHRG